MLGPGQWGVAELNAIVGQAEDRGDGMCDSVTTWTVDRVDTCWSAATATATTTTATTTC